ncbi:hypothetical protein WA026_013152 [Henosepilachna vigintioctopunctata]|uniref:Uncharacterized protein n=1 Tax=Henosepilachna vigintioctopunctata TaxID=420089 RepID=A0AAW1UE77_9CUCU
MFKYVCIAALIAVVSAEPAAKAQFVAGPVAAAIVPHEPAVIAPYSAPWSYPYSDFPYGYNHLYAAGYPHSSAYKYGPYVAPYAGAYNPFYRSVYGYNPHPIDY